MPNGSCLNFDLRLCHSLRLNDQLIWILIVWCKESAEDPWIIVPIRGFRVYINKPSPLNTQNEGQVRIFPRKASRALLKVQETLENSPCKAPCDGLAILDDILQVVEPHFLCCVVVHYLQTEDA